MLSAPPLTAFLLELFRTRLRKKQIKSRQPKVVAFNQKQTYFRFSVVANIESMDDNAFASLTSRRSAKKVANLTNTSLSWSRAIMPLLEETTLFMATCSMDCRSMCFSLRSMKRTCEWQNSGTTVQVGRVKCDKMNGTSKRR